MFKYDYDLFKQSISRLVRRRHYLTEEEMDIEYTYIKAELYQINYAAFRNYKDLEQEIKKIESMEKAYGKN